MPFGTKKLEWCGCVPDGEKNLMISLFVLTEFTNVTNTHAHTDRQTDRQTA